MKKISAKILSLILAAFVVLGALPLSVSAAEVTMQDDLTKVENLDAIVSDGSQNFIKGWAATSNKNVPMTLCNTYTTGTTVDKAFVPSSAKIATMTNGIVNETHADLNGSESLQWFDSNKQWVEGHIDMTFTFPAAASITNFLLATVNDSQIDRRMWEYQVFAGNEFETLYTDANLLYHYNEGGVNTPTKGQYITFGETIEAKYFGVRILKGCNPNSADNDRNYSYPRIREIAIIGSLVVPDEYKATAAKWVNPCLEALDTDYNLLNGADYTSGDGTPGTITASGFNGTKEVSVGIRSYNPDACDLVDHNYTKNHADISGVNFFNANGYIEGVYTDVTVALLHEADVDKVLISHATSVMFGLRTYEYELYAGNDFDTLYQESNKVFHFVNENDLQHQVYEFATPVTIKYLGIRILKGVQPNCSVAGSSYVRLSEIAVFGKYNTDYYDYFVTSGEADLINASGNVFAGKSLKFTTPLCENGYTFRGWKVNGKEVEANSADLYSNSAEILVTITENTEIEAVYTPDDTEFTSNDKYTVSADKTTIRIPQHTVLYELRYGFPQYPQNISAKKGETVLADKEFLKPGDNLVLSSNGIEKQSLSVVYEGDFNNDGTVAVSDIVAGIDAIFNKNATDTEEFAFDLNNSGTLTVSDVIRVRKNIFTTPTEETDYDNVTVPMKDLDYKTQGRYVKNTDGSVKFDWTASGFSFNADIYGDIVFNVTQGPNDARWYTAVIDGVEHDVRIKGNSAQDVVIARNISSGVHSIGFYKQHEGGNTITINSVKINGKVLTADAENDLLIEFIGDSLTCGFGNLAVNGQESLFEHSQDGYNSYGTATARILGADWSNISVSGSSLIDDRDREPTRNHMPTEYKNAIKGSNPKSTDTPAWDFASNRNADIVVINLGSNDNGCIAHYSGVDTDKKVAYFKNDVLKFARQIIEANGDDVKIVFAFGMATDKPIFADEAYQQAIVALAAEGFTNAFYCRLPTDKTGGYSHPTVAGDWAAARVLSEFIKTEVLK